MFYKQFQDVPKMFLTEHIQRFLYLSECPLIPGLIAPSRGHPILAVKWIVRYYYSSLMMSYKTELSHLTSLAPSLGNKTGSYSKYHFLNDYLVGFSCLTWLFFNDHYHTSNRHRIMEHRFSLIWHLRSEPKSLKFCYYYSLYFTDKKIEA